MVWRTLGSMPRLPDCPSTPPKEPGRFKLYPTCRVKGCQNDPGPRSEDCYRHQLVDAF